jgi:hypothetical protein
MMTNRAIRTDKRDAEQEAHSDPTIHSEETVIQTWETSNPDFIDEVLLGSTCLKIIPNLVQLVKFRLCESQVMNLAVNLSWSASH